MAKDWWLWCWVPRQRREPVVVYGLMRAGEAYCAIFDKGLEAERGIRSRKRKS
jgi:hypothetical protein